MLENALCQQAALNRMSEREHTAEKPLFLQLSTQHWVEVAATWIY